MKAHQLLRKLLEFYATFKFQRLAISVAAGEPIARGILPKIPHEIGSWAPFLNTDRIDSSVPLVIYEPFNGADNCARTVINPDYVIALKSLFHTELSQNLRNIRSLLEVNADLDEINAVESVAHAK